MNELSQSKEWMDRREKNWRQDHGGMEGWKGWVEVKSRVTAQLERCGTKVGLVCVVWQCGSAQRAESKQRKGQGQGQGECWLGTGRWSSGTVWTD